MAEDKSAEFAPLDRRLRAACAARFTGAVVRVEQAGRLRFERAYGALDDSAEAPAVKRTTRFDLASLTKIFVATAALQAVGARSIGLDAPLGSVLPEWRANAHEAITLRMLLAHIGGLHSGADYRSLLNENVERFALVHPLAVPPGREVIYSDLGFIALGIVLERLHRQSLAAVLDRSMVEVEIADTVFRPRARERAAIPATEDDGWRGRVRGVVHDEKAWLMGGVAGHAGLFGTARDVALLAQVYLGPACGRPSPALSAALAREAIQQWGADVVLRRGLGWALKTTDQNSCGRLMSSDAFGHTGFTGTCVWADPARDLVVVLLTNSVYYGRSDTRDLRAGVCDDAVAASG